MAGGGILKQVNEWLKPGKGRNKYDSLESRDDADFDSGGSPSDASPPQDSKLAILSSYASQVYIPSLFVFGANGMVIPVIPPYARKVFDANDAQNGLVMSSLNMAGVLLDIPGAFLIARVGADLSGVFSGSMLFLSGFIAAFAPNIFILTLSRFMHGLGQVTWLTSRTFIFSLSSSTSQQNQNKNQQNQSHNKRTSNVENNRGLLISGLGGMQRISNLLMPMLGSFVAAKFGYQSVFLLVSFFGAAVLPFAFGSYIREKKAAKAQKKVNSSISLQSLSEDSEQNDKSESLGRKSRGPLRLVLDIIQVSWLDLLLVGSPCLVLNMLRQARDFLFAVAAMNAGFGQAEIGFLITSMYTMDFLSFPLSGYLMDKFGRKYALVSSLACISMGCILLSIVAGDSHKIVLFLVAFVAGSGSGIGAGIAMCMGADLASVVLLKFRLRANEVANVSDKFVMTIFLGIFRATQDLGQMFGPQLVGTLSNEVSLSFSGSLCGSIGLLAALFSVCCVRETKDMAKEMKERLQAQSRDKLEMATM